MEKYDIYATLDIHTVAEGTSPEDALKTAIENNDYEVLNSKIGNRKAEDYIPLSEFAKRHNIADGGIYIRKLCQQGKFPGAVKIGRNWCVPANATFIDRRIKTGKYIGNHTYRNYIKPKRDREKLESTPDSTDME